MKSCKRKKGWPKWARFKAMDTNCKTYVYAKEPEFINYFCDMEWAVFGSDTRIKNVGHCFLLSLLPLETRTRIAENSLRKIED